MKKLLKLNLRKRGLEEGKQKKSQALINKTVEMNVAFNDKLYTYLSLNKLYIYIKYYIKYI